MSSNEINQKDYEMIYIKNNDVVIVHVEPYTISLLTREQAQNLGFDIYKMKAYDNISINGIPKGGYEVVEYYIEHKKTTLKMDPEMEKFINSLDLE
ncbi:hypothetical protein IRY51_001107 [Salmonella enterica]|uniref:Uncharacterized protein n=1 Tax=Salmonella enterica TaxID=28901 RepID=A0A3J4NAP4_SALER|nr:hypothetical protein [Salmonella enterica]MFK71233.1 hypothetical protein [Salmonella enterica]